MVKIDIETFKDKLRKDNSNGADSPEGTIDDQLTKFCARWKLLVAFSRHKHKCSIIQHHSPGLSLLSM